MTEKHHCHLCPKDCSSPEYNSNRVTLETTWEELSLPSHFMDCIMFRKTANSNRNIIPIVTT